MSGLNEFDDDRLIAYTGYKKADLNKAIETAGYSTNENIRIVELMDWVKISYYNGVAQEYAEALRYDPNNEELRVRYNVAVSRRDTAMREIKGLSAISTEIDKAASGVNDMIARDLPLTNKFSGQTYQGYTFKNNNTV